MSRVVGAPVPRVDARAKVTGAARYAADAPVAGAAHGVMVLSTIARGRVTVLDTRAAESATGVIAVFTHLNMPRLAVPSSTAGYFKRYLPMQTDRINHNGQPIAYVVAETLEQAQHAATLVTATYESEPPEVVIAEVMPHAYVPPETFDGPNDIVRGDPAAGFARADVRVDAAYTTPMHHHNPMEPSATTASWDGQVLTVHETTQGISRTQASLAAALGIPAADVIVLSPFLGGGFGAKGPVWPHTMLTAAVAREVRRPVKLVLSRAQTYTSNGHRAAAHQQVRLGATRDGRLTAVEHVTTQQVSRTDETMFNSSEPTRMLYAVPNLRTVQQVVRLDLPTQSFMRAPEAIANHGLECALDELATELGLDPIEVRLRNYAEVDPETGAPWGSKNLRECYRRGAELFGWAERNPLPRSLTDGDALIGVGMATAGHTAGGRPGSGARLTLGVDGTALIQSGTHDIGTGTYTVMSQIAAQSLGVPLDAVRFELGDTRFPATDPAGASATVPSVGSAVNRAARAVRAAATGIAVADPQSPLYGVPPDRIGAEDGVLFVTDEAGRRVSYKSIMERHGEPLVVTSEPAPVPLGFSTGAVFVEVRVDPRLGRVQVRRIVGVYDTGTVLNLRTVTSQAIGGAVWAVGFTLMEHTVVDPALARIVNPNLSTYLVPVNADIPDVQIEFVDQPDPAAADSLGARGFGETPMTGVTAAIANAIHHATGRRIRDLPITQDRLL
ncbi:xanthine dehydrogenase family protein molybdopterin-binding subunit [Pseudonocardia xinjiangensis]|uniref:xanthine dehydrogenase family protein molybdopterin-binding subunit n=1 Tax=Pseudonocardia xinjiangensis TaxID=75289 RepID=UPI003D89D667